MLITAQALIYDYFWTVVDPCVLNRTECSLVKLISEAAWDIGQVLGINYISYGDFWKLLGCECVKAEFDPTYGILTCGLLNVHILHNCPCYGCISLDTWSIRAICNLLKNKEILYRFKIDTIVSFLWIELVNWNVFFVYFSTLNILKLSAQFRMVSGSNKVHVEKLADC